MEEVADRVEKARIHRRVSCVLGLAEKKVEIKSD